MTDSSPNSAARKMAQALREMAPFVLFGGGAVGCLYFVHDLIALADSAAELSHGQQNQVRIVAVIALSIYSLGGWVLSRLLRALAAALDLLVGQRESSDRIEQGLAALQDRLSSAPLPAAAVGDPRQDLAEVRRAIQHAEWERAEDLVEDFAQAHPDHSKVSQLATDLAEARRIAADGLRAQIDAARQAQDPSRVLDLRVSLRPLLSGEMLRSLDHDLAPWLMALIQKRLRVIPIQADVVLLAGRVAEQFDQTKEGASLRAALATLRRSVGLCPRCGMPYPGLADACPQCLAPAPDAVPVLEPIGTMNTDSLGDDLSTAPSDELEDFRKFLDSPA